MKLIFISGQPGSGKTSVANELLNQSKSAALIEADSLSTVNPFDFYKNSELAIKNAVALTGNFNDAGYKNIIISGLVKNQKDLDDFLNQLDQKAEILFVWLRAGKTSRIIRKHLRGRDKADDVKHFDFIDNLIPDLKSIEIKNGKSIFINTSSKSVAQIAEEIINNLK